MSRQKLTPGQGSLFNVPIVEPLPDEFKILEAGDTMPVSTPEPQKTMLDHALEYARRGWAVMPCHTPTDEKCSCNKPDCSSIGKHPRSKNGVKDATTDEAQIRQWWRQWPTANIGIATGKISNLVVLDVDPRNGGDKSLQNIRESIPELDQTVQVLTGGGGQHFYFEASEIPLKKASGFLPGLDFMAEGVYIIAPPSLHKSGKCYEFELSSHPDDTAILPLPETLLARLKCPKPEKTLHSKTSVSRNTTISEGHRNDVLFKQCMTWQRRGMTFTEIQTLAQEMNQRKCNPSLEDSEVETIVQSAMSYRNDEALPEIIINGRQRREVTQEAINAILKANQHQISRFRLGNALVRVQEEAGSNIRVEAFTLDLLMYDILRVANWMRTEEKEGETIYHHTSCSPAIAKDILASPALPFPLLKGISKVPLVSPSGHIFTEPGYDAATNYWLCGLPAIAPLPESPSLKDAQAAVTWIEQELLSDFPFADESSKAHVWSALLLPFLRLLIADPIPMHLLDAPVAGSGKTLLAKIIMLVALGEEAPTLTECEDSAEWRKKITAILLEAPSLVLLDNVNKKLNSGELAAALTSRLWGDRLLGSSKMIRVPIDCLWLVTGNNVQISNELARRTVLIRLEPKQARPFERTGFRHHPLEDWVKTHRGEILYHLLMILAYWTSCGQPRGGKTLGSFEQWASVMSGILDCVGISGFLDNAKNLYESADDDTLFWESLGAACMEKYTNQAIGLAEIFPLALGLEGNEAILGSGSKGEQSQRSKFGKQLHKQRNVVFSHFALMPDGTSRNGARLYRFQPRPTN